MSRKLLFVILFCAVLSIALIAIANATGGGIEGTVTDPKGGLVVGANVALTNVGTNESTTVTTDSQGRFKFSNLGSGTYSIVVQARSFSSFKQENINVEEGKISRFNVKLEIAPIILTTTAKEIKATPNKNELYQSLRKQSSDPVFDSYAKVNNLVIKRDAATFTLRSGEIYFFSPVEGKVTGAVFIGDGEFSLTPPTKIEKDTLAVFTDAPDIKENFTNLVIRFSDKTFEEIKNAENIKLEKRSSQIVGAREIYQEKEKVMREKAHYNIALRILMDIYKPQRRGCFYAFVGGKRFSKLLFTIDTLGVQQFFPFRFPLFPEQVSLQSYGDNDAGTWTAFHLEEEYKRNTANNLQDKRLFDITHHEIEAAIGGTRIGALDQVTFTSRTKGERVIPFELYPTLRVTRVTDEQQRELDFIQENKNDDADFAVILPEPTEFGKTYKLLIEYTGEGALDNEGNGNFFLNPGARTSWYPNNAGSLFGDRATFNIKFSYPKNFTFIGVGNLTEPEKEEAGLKIGKWSSGSTELAVAGFNYGKFKRKDLQDASIGYGLEIYANTELPAGLSGFNISGSGVLGSLNTVGRMDQLLQDTRNSALIYNNYFGKPPYSRIAMTQQTAPNFGQAWPTLIYMPIVAFFDETQRSALIGRHGGIDNFWHYVGPHEVAHQWWGHVIGWKSYHDQWMSEGFAEFSASLYVQFVRQDMKKFIDYWDDQRKLIVTASPSTRGMKPYTVGPVTQGYRLSNRKTGGIARYMIYPKGAYILHMIRMMMYDRKDGDEKFRQMMQDFTKSFYNTDITTEDFKRIVEKHITPLMDVDKNGTMSWFFDQFVYGTEIPAYTFEYQIGKTADGKTVANGKITQSGVSNDFAMVVPIYIDFGKGWAKYGSVVMVGNSTSEVKDIVIPAETKQVAICALNDVLATSIQNKKRRPME